MATLHLGIDLGTSACRAVLAGPAGDVRAAARAPLPPPAGGAGEMAQDPAAWWTALRACLEALRARHPLDGLAALAVAGTSGSVLLCDPAGRPLGPALLYGDRRATAQAERIDACAPPDSPARGPASGLAKALWLLEHLRPGPCRLVHQADWINGRLTGRWGVTDHNNALKTGYDPRRRAWPAWIRALGLPPGALPEVVPPGTPLAPLAREAAAALGLPPGTTVCAGTTDSVAAFLATGAGVPGDGVTSLGSTLALKLVSPRPVFSPRHGVYSHRLGRLWLAGGASNSGGRALLAHFSLEEIQALTPRLAPGRPTGLDYYPLPGPGERFPLADPGFPGRLAPVPADRARFLQGLLEGIARIEARGYRLLETLGAPPVARVYTTGGGARNPAWTAIRARMLGVPLAEPASTEAAAGAARLAAGRLPA